MVNKEEIKFVSKSWVFGIQRVSPVIKELTCGFEVVQHDFPILGYRVQKRLIACRCLIVPHLQDVDDLTNVVSRALNQSVNSYLVQIEAFTLSNFHHFLSDCLDWRLLEFEIVAVSYKRLQLAVLPIVANADNRRLRLFDDLYERTDATSVASTHSVNFIHNDN